MVLLRLYLPEHEVTKSDHADIGSGFRVDQEPHAQVKPAFRLTVPPQGWLGITNLAGKIRYSKTFAKS